jgi:hypothetical protein
MLESQRTEAVNSRIGNRDSSTVYVVSKSGEIWSVVVFSNGNVLVQPENKQIADIFTK